MDDVLKSMDMGGIHGSSMGIHMNTTIFYALKCSDICTMVY
jgi:hypothetical protein